jgi:DNA-directed RNA polymerase subunit K/omega
MLLVRLPSTLFALTESNKGNRYRLFRSYFNETRQWRNFDPFFAQKEEMFKNSGTAIYQIAASVHELEREKERLRSNPDKLLVLFREMIQMCLWRAFIS